MKFLTSDNEIIQGTKLQNALNKVADDWEKLGYDILKENAYADHVTQETKDKNLQSHIDLAKTIRSGEITSFTIWQRVNKELTGKCIGLLAQNKSIQL